MMNYRILLNGPNEELLLRGVLSDGMEVERGKVAVLHKWGSELNTNHHSFSILPSFLPENGEDV